MDAVLPHPQDKGQPKTKPKFTGHRQTIPGQWKDSKHQEELPYETLKRHRDALLASQIQYETRIKQLEEDTVNFRNTYEATDNENKVLKSKLEYGPDAVKTKKLNKDLKQQQTIKEKLQDENKTLTARIEELEKKYGEPIHNDSQKHWNETLAKVDTKTEQEDVILPHGPFVAGNVKPKRVTINAGVGAFQDAFDLHLDTMEKEAQILSNKIKGLKREKLQIDCATQMGKGDVTRNAVVADSINETVNSDLNRIAIRLEKLKLKHDAIAKTATSESHNPSDLSPDTPYVTKISHKKVVGVKQRTSTFQNDNNIDGLEPSLKAVKKPHSLVDDLNIVRHKAKTTADNQSHIHRKTLVSSTNHGLKDMIKASANEPRVPVTTTDIRKPNNVNSNTPRMTSKTKINANDRPVPVNSTNIKKHNDGNSNTPKLAGKAKASASDRTLPINKTDVRKQNNGNSNTPGLIDKTKANAKDTNVPVNTTDVRKQNSGNSDTVGRYSHGPEPIQKKKTDKSKDKLKYSKTIASKSAPNIPPKTYNKHPPIRRDSKHITEEPSYDTVLAYLRNRQYQNDNPVKFDEEYDERIEKRTMSPIPIRFVSNGQLLDQNEIRLVMGNTGIRRDSYYTLFQ